MDGYQYKKIISSTEEAFPPVHSPVVLGGEYFIRTQQDVRRIQDSRVLTICKVTPTGDIISMDGVNYDAATRQGILNTAAQAHLQMNNTGNSSLNILAEILARLGAATSNANSNNTANNIFTAQQTTNALQELFAQFNIANRNNSFFNTQEPVNNCSDRAIAEMLTRINKNQNRNNNWLSRLAAPQGKTDQGTSTSGECSTKCKSHDKDTKSDEESDDDICEEPGPVVASIKKQMDWDECPENSSAPFSFTSNAATSTTELSDKHKKKKGRHSESGCCKMCRSRKAARCNQATNTCDDDFEQESKSSSDEEEVSELAAQKKALLSKAWNPAC